MEKTTQIGIGPGKGDAEAILEDARRFSEIQGLLLDLLPESEDGRPETLLLSVPQANGGREVVETEPLLADLREHPRRKKGFAELTDLDAFIAHHERFADGSRSVIFANDDPEHPELRSVHNYHHPEGPPGHGDYGAVYRFPLSEEWKAWTELDRWMDQRAFAEVLEDRIVDVADPKSAPASVTELADSLEMQLASPNKLLSLSRGLKVHVKGHVVNVTNLSTGEAQVAFEEKHTDAQGQQLRVPGMFAITIPVFRGGPLFAIAVLLRYRVEGSFIRWGVKLHRQDAILRKVLGEAVAQVREEVPETPLYFGKPGG